MIEIGLDQYADIFSEWDPAPFKRRSLDPDLELYLEGSAEEIPLHYPIELYFTLPSGTRNEAIEAETRNGLENSCRFKMYLLKQEIRKINTRMLRYILFGFIFLWSGTFFSTRFIGASFLSLLAEALFIGGWVFIWEAISLFFFTKRELYQRYRTFNRLKNAPMIFRETEASNHAKK